MTAGQNISGVEGAPSSAIAHTPPSEDAAQGERQCGGDTDRKSAARAGIAREPGLLEAAVRVALRAAPGSGHTGEWKLHTPSSISFLEKIIFPDRAQNYR